MTPTYYVQHPDGSYSVADPQPPAVTQRQYETALRQWESWKAYALEIQARLVKYEGGSPMVLNAAPTDLQAEYERGLEAAKKEVEQFNVDGVGAIVDAIEALKGPTE